MPEVAHVRIRPEIGDVIEISTPRGLGYAQYTHEHRDPPTYGSLVRVLPGLFPTRPADLGPLIEEEERFSVFVPLGSALRRRDFFRIAANVPVPAAKKDFPVFGSLSGDRTFWWMWNGKREWEARSPDERTPHALRSVWNDTLLIERIADQAWIPPEEGHEALAHRPPVEDMNATLTVLDE